MQNSICPIKLVDSNLNSFKSAAQSKYENDYGERNTIQFRISLIDSIWLPVEVNMSHLQYNGYFLTPKSASAKRTSETIIICETVNNMDKRRICLRSQVQVLNLFQLPVCISFQMAEQCSAKKPEWHDHSIKPGKKWSLPIKTLYYSETNLIKIAPIVPNSNYEKQAIVWDVDKSKLLEFDKNIFIQANIEREALDISMKSIIGLFFYPGTLLLPVINKFSFFNIFLMI